MLEAGLSTNANSYQSGCSISIWASNLIEEYKKIDFILVPNISSKELKENYEKYGTAVLRLATSILQNHAAAEDLVHDVFIRFWTTNKYDESKGTKLNYFLTLTRSMALNQLNKSRNRKKILEKWKSFFNQSKNTIDQDLQQKERMTKIQISLANLSKPQREVLEICYIEGHSHQQAAKMLNMALGTVKTHARRGLISLRKQMESLGGDI